MLNCVAKQCEFHRCCLASKLHAAWCMAYTVPRSQAETCKHAPLFCFPTLLLLSTGAFVKLPSIRSPATISSNTMADAAAALNPGWVPCIWKGIDYTVRPAVDQLHMTGSPLLTGFKLETRVLCFLQQLGGPGCAGDSPHDGAAWHTRGWPLLLPRRGAWQVVLCAEKAACKDRGSRGSSQQPLRGRTFDAA
jgi:hypothetical protein